MTDGPILVTGAAGFIGAAVSEALLARGAPVIGVDNLNDYYDVRLKQARLDRLTGEPHFDFHQLDISNRDRMLKLAADFPGITHIVHLAKWVRFLPWRSSASPIASVVVHENEKTGIRKYFSKFSQTSDRSPL